VSTLIDEPLSWLTLERYVLGELSASERAQVEQRLAESQEDRACLASILSDSSELPALPELPASDLSRVASIESARKKRHGWALLTTALAAAAAMVLAVLEPGALPSASRQVSDGTKGGEVAIALYGERLGERPGQFAAGDRFKLLVTCPAWLGRRLHVVMFQGGRRYQPLAGVTDFACGNRVAWPGAFALDGDDAVDVCVTWSDRAAVAESARELEPEVVCERVEAR
jgi:anti-sigma factor RsiW